MAVVHAGMACWVCSQVLDLEGPFFATTALHDGEGLPIAGSDSAMHWSCLFGRPDVDRFLARVEGGCRLSLLENPYWEVIVDDAEVLVAVNPDPTHDRDRGLIVRVPGTGMAWDLSVARFPGCLTAMLGGPLAHLPAERLARVERAVRKLVATAPQIEAELRRRGAPRER